MSKVVHLSDEAHAKAKAHCKERGLRMSDWVATLIDAAIEGHMPVGPRPGVVPVQKRKDIRRVGELEDQNVEAVLAAPPFWAARAGSRG